MVSGIRSAGQPDFFHHSISHIFVLVRFLLVLIPKIYFLAFASSHLKHGPHTHMNPEKQHSCQHQHHRQWNAG